MTRNDAAMAADGVVAAGPERLLHEAARRAFAGAFEQRRTDTEVPVLQSQKVDSADNKVAAQKIWRNLVPAEERGDCHEILCRDQRDLARPVPPGVVAIALHAVAGDHLRRGRSKHRRPAGRTQADPFQPARPHRAGQQTANRRISWQRHHSSSAGMRRRFPRSP